MIATAAAPAMIHIDTRKARPMRRSSASTSSSGSESARGNWSRCGEDGADIAGVAPFALQRIDDHRFGGVVGWRIGDAMLCDRGVARVVVRLVARIERAMALGARLVAERGGNEREVVVGGEVLAVEHEHLLEPVRSLAQKRLAPVLRLRSALQLGALVQRLPELGERAVVLAEVELALACFGELRIDHCAVIGDRLVELAVLLVH